MSFIETEASVRYEIIDGERIPVITPKCEVTLTNTVTGKEYMGKTGYTNYDMWLPKAQGGKYGTGAVDSGTTHF